MGPLKPGPGLGRGVSTGLQWAFTGCSLLLLGTVIAAIVGEYRAEWRSWQRRHAALSPAGSGDGGEIEAGPGLQQIWLADLDRVDRCTSCHLGIADPGSAGAPQPFRTHPGRWLELHRPDRFGCTVCHGGQGEATTYAGAGHLGQAKGGEAMVSRELMEARCGTCHQERQPRGAHWLARGRALLLDRNCAACHELPGHSPIEVRAPRLDDLDQKVSPPWLRSWLKQPRDYDPKTRMGEFRLSDREIEGLIAFLLTRPRQQALEPVDWSEADLEKGGEIFRRSRCVTCHAVNGRGGSLAPELTHVGSKASREWLYSWLRDPHRLQPATLMPRFRLDDVELRDLAAYLADEFAEPPEGLAAGEAPIERGLAEEGRRTFERRGCYSCHALEGFPALAGIGPKLAAIGDRVLEPQPLIVRGWRANLPNWLFTKVSAPDAVHDPARMPTFGFSDAEAAAVTTALLSLRARPMPASFVTTDPRRPEYVPQGEFGRLVRRYRCLSCHSIQGTGGTLSTVPLDRIGSQLTREHLERFVRQPYSVRVGLPERMPQLGLTVEEARTVADHLARVMVDDAVEGAVPSDPGAVADGRRLYGEHGCAACHIAGERGGYVGPELNGTALRLKPGWVVAWLLSPQRWKPGTLEPEHGLSRQEAGALAAYVLSLPPRRAKGAER